MTNTNFCIILSLKELILMNKKTVALTTEQYEEIISTMRNGFSGFRPNNRVATALMLEANLGLRISDIVKLKLADIVKDGERLRLDITEQKTNKKRFFTVPQEIYNFLKGYCYDNGIAENEVIFKLTTTAIQKQLRIVCDYLGYEKISTHSFRKFFATQIYNKSDYNIALVQTLLQHSSAAVTQKYIGIEQKQIEKALAEHICLI